MQETIFEFTEPTIGKKLWNIRHQVGSMLVFEFGKPTEDGDGEYHYWINCCHWWLQQGTEHDFEDIVCSNSSKKNIAAKIGILEGKKLLNINYLPENGTTYFDFEDNLFLTTSPYGIRERFGDYSVEDDPTEQWYLFKDDKVLSVLDDGTYTIKNASE